MISIKCRTKSALLALSIIFIFSSSAFSQSIEPLLDKYLEAYYKAKNVPSVCAGALVEGKLLWVKGLGYADVENSVRTNTQTVYRIASVSKPITAIAVMQLVEKGLIKLDDDISKYVPYFPKKKWPVTVRELLTHTSGIRGYRPGEFDSKEFYSGIKEAVLTLASDSLEFKPGTKYSYNTLAYNLLAAAVENVSKLSFGDYLKKRVFDPAGMSLTKLEVQADIVTNRAHGYVKTADSIKNAPLADLSVKYAGGGIISNVEDLLKLGKALIENKLILKSTLDSMLVPTFLPNGERIDYGLGFGFGSDSLNRRSFSHAGGGTGFCSHFAVYPEQKAVFVYLINTRENNLDNPALDIASIVLFDGNKEIPLNGFLQKFLKK